MLHPPSISIYRLRYVHLRIQLCHPRPQQVANPLGMIFKGAQFTRSQDDGYAVQDFILSRDALKVLNEQLGVRNAFSSKDVDIVSRQTG